MAAMMVFKHANTVHISVMGNINCYDHPHVIVDTPDPPIILDTTKKEEGEKVTEDQQGIRLSELEF